MRAARAVFIVCTPELPSLSMAPWRIADLERHGVEPSRIHCVVNRWERKGMSAEDAAEILGRPVYATMPNAYKEVKEATLAGRPAQPASALAKSCEALARKACRTESPVARPLGLPFLRKLGLSSA